MWGRSMGAVTALMHADRDPSIAGMVIDSAFSSLRKLAEELCKQYTKIPGFILSGALGIVNSTIKSKAKFDINNLTPINHVKSSFIPAMFVAAKSDIFIKPEHTKELHQAYQGDKNIAIVEGDHNSYRPQFLLDSIGIFFYNTLQCADLPTEPMNNNEDEKNQEEEEKGNLFFHNNQHIGNQHEVAAYLGDFNEDDLALAMKLSLQEGQKQEQQGEEKKQEGEEKEQKEEEQKQEKEGVIIKEEEEKKD